MATCMVTLMVTSMEACMVVTCNNLFFKKTTKPDGQIDNSELIKVTILFSDCVEH